MHKHPGSQRSPCGVPLQPPPTAAGQQEAGTLGSSLIAKPGETVGDDLSAENLGRGHSMVELSALGAATVSPGNLGHHKCIPPKRTPGHIRNCMHNQPPNPLRTHLLKHVQGVSSDPDLMSGKTLSQGPCLPRHTKFNLEVKLKHSHSTLSSASLLAVFPLTFFSHSDSPHQAHFSHRPESRPSKEGRTWLVRL